MLDIAAGRGRYLLDAVARRGNAVAELLLRDSCPRNVTEGSRMIEERGLASLARFENANAFDRGALAALGSRWTVAIVSGLYELIPANAPVRESLAELADAVAPGGYLLYTGQPWHPQLELIARTLRSHQGKQPWVMRRRTQAELDSLLKKRASGKSSSLRTLGECSPSLLRKGKFLRERRPRTRQDANSWRSEVELCGLTNFLSTFRFWRSSGDRIIVPVLWRAL